MDHGAAAGLGQARRLRGLQIVWQYYPGAGIQIRCSAPSARSTRSGPRARRRRSARPSTSCCRSPPSAPAGSPGSTTSTTARARHRGSRASPRAPRCRRSRAPPGGCRQQADLPLHEPRPRDLSSGPAPEGVRVPAGAGVHYAQYSFEPGLRILNGFIQSLVGLYDYGRIAADTRAGAVRAGRGARPRGGADLRHGRLVAVLARDGHARVRPRLPRCCATSSSRCATARGAPSTAAPRSASPGPDDRPGREARQPPAARRDLREAQDVAGQDLRHDAADHARREARAHPLRGQPVARGAHARLAGAAQARRLHGHARRARPRGQSASATGDVRVLKPRKKKRS